VIAGVGFKISSSSSSESSANRVDTFFLASDGADSTGGVIFGGAGGAGGAIGANDFGGSGFDSIT